MAKIKEEKIPSILEYWGMKKGKEEEGEGTEDGGKKEVDVDELIARLDRLESSNETLQRSNIALMSQPQAAPITPYVPEPPSISEGLPDPSLDPELYNKQLEARIVARIDSAVEANSLKNKQEVDNSSRIDALWDEFAEAHEDHAENADQVDFAAGKVATRAQQKGLNLENYMFANSSVFFDEIVREMDKTFPKITKEEKKEEEKQDTAKENEDVNRTGGIFGGVESGGSPSDEAKEVGGDMITDLQDMQRESGFF